MRILYLCHRLPYPPDKGDRVRAFHHLEHLARRHRVHLVTLGNGQGDSDRVAALRRHGVEVDCFRLSPTASAVRCAAALAGGGPLSLAHFRHFALRARLRHLAATRGFDAVIAYCSSMAPYASLFPAVPRLLDLVDVDSAKWRHYARIARAPMSALYALEGRRLRAYESTLHRRFGMVVVTTGRELRTLRSICPAARSAVVRNGVDLDYFRATEATPNATRSVVFTGQMDYLPNVDAVVEFARNTLPLLRAEVAGARFTVVGRSPVGRVRRLESLPGVHVTGEVDDIRPFLARATVFVAPLRIARGVQNKVLEAMAAGLPVVCSPETFAGLADGGFRDGEHLRVAAGPEATAAAVGGLMRDRDAREGIARAARRRLEHNYSWARNAAELENRLMEVVDRHRAAVEQGPALSTASEGRFAPAAAPQPERTR